MEKRSCCSPSVGRNKSTSTDRDTTVKGEVRRHYGELAKTQSRSCECSGNVSSGADQCCGASVHGLSLGYTVEDLKALPEKALSASAGCGNPTALAKLRAGETVLDLGSGGGIDVFIAANKVGPTGKAIGVDMTPEMIDLARSNAKQAGITNVEFRLGEIEHLPVADDSVDVIISNCVINLSTDKDAVFREAYRVLRKGGRVLVSDVMAEGLPKEVRENLATYVQCVGGALALDDYLNKMKAVGFENITVINNSEYSEEFLADSIASMNIDKGLFKNATTVKISHAEISAKKNN